MGSAVIFSFYDKDNADCRTLYDHHGIKILDVDEGGNVKFAVYGYMNRGRHEGETGIQILSYDNSLNTIEEEVYIPYSKSYAVLKDEMGQLCTGTGSSICTFSSKTVSMMWIWRTEAQSSW